MKVAFLGGTGTMGRALARRLAEGNEVYIGSRTTEKAKSAAKTIPGVRGVSNLEAALWCETAIVTVPYAAIRTLGDYANPLAGKIVVSVLNPLKKSGGVLEYAAVEKSAAELVASLLPESAVATAFNNIPVSYFSKERAPEVDVLIAAESSEVYKQVAKLVLEIPKLRPLYVGPLSQASSIERLTVMLLNAAALNRTSSLSVKFVS
jgi:NADPH-dependent F420 reductase